MELDQLLASLNTPEIDGRDPSATLGLQDSAAIDTLRRGALSTLTSLRDNLPDDMTPTLKADRVATIAQYYTEAPWVTPEVKRLALEMLAQLAPLQPEVSHIVLFEHVKPCFARNPHPDLNLSTGRRLARPIGGTAATMDMYEEQPWKEHPTVLALVLWCTENLPVTDFERMWHLLVPPMMTLLDDYETRHKIWGVRVASVFIGRAPPDVLRRTGIAGLLDETLSKTFIHLHNPETPDLLRLAIPTYIHLINRTNERDSAARFDKLSNLLGHSIIGTIWGYGSQDEETIRTTVDLLPQIVDELGVAACRYLKYLVPQLLHPMRSDPLQKVTSEMWLSSLKSLRCVMSACRERVPAWSEVILSSLCRGWVKCVDDPGRPETPKIQTELQDTVKLLIGLHPPAQSDLRRVQAAEGELFRGFI